MSATAAVSASSISYDLLPPEEMPKKLVLPYVDAEVIPIPDYRLRITYEADRATQIPVSLIFIPATFSEGETDGIRCCEITHNHAPAEKVIAEMKRHLTEGDFAAADKLIIRISHCAIAILCATPMGHDYIHSIAQQDKILYEQLIKLRANWTG